MRLSFAPLLVLPLAAAEKDGCWAPIPASSVISVGGSPGYMVGCSSESGPLSFVRGREKFKHRRGRSSFLQQDGGEDDQLIQVCFTGSGSSSTMTQMAYAEVTLSEDFVVRGVDFTASSVANKFTVNSRNSQSEDPEWFVSISDSDSGAPWTKISVGSTSQFDSDFSGQYVRLVPALSAGETASGTSFQAELFGCSSSHTALVSFKFSSSKSAIITRFGKMSSFITELAQYVCQITKFTKRPATCPRVLYADIADGVNPNPASDGIAPAQLPFVEVYFRILPPASDCSDCRDATSVQIQLSKELSDTSSNAYKMLQAIDQWIEDEDPYTCFNKQCPSGTLCVNGACVTPMDLMTQQQALSSRLGETQFASPAQLDLTLQLSPLEVIQGVDASAGKLSFSSKPILPGSVLTARGSTGLTPAASPAPSTTSIDSFISRFFIPIVVLGSITLLILALIGYKVYRRQYLTEEQRASLMQ